MVRQTSLLDLLENEEKVLADMGYIGEIQIITPIKGKNLDVDQKAYNRFLGSIRWVVEHVLRRIKIFKCVNVKWRHWRELHCVVFYVICEIVNIDFEFRPVRK